MGCRSLQIIGADDITVNQGADFNLRDGVSAYDSNQDEIDFSTEPTELDMCDVGVHEVIYSASGIDDSQLLPNVCVVPRLYAPNVCNFNTVYKKRYVTIEQADPPVISGVGNEQIDVGESFDLMSGVSAVDDNGNVVSVTFSGEIDKYVSGAIASFVTDLERPLKLARVTISPTQSGSGTPSPSNVRPIYGVGGVEVDRVGKNLFDKVNCGILNAYINANTIITSNSHRTIYIPCKPNTTYVLSNNSGNNRRTIGYTTALPVIGSSVVLGTNGVITTGTNAKYLVSYCWNGTSDTVTLQEVLDAIQIEIGSEPTTYEPYTESTVSQEFDVSLTPTSTDTDPYLFKAVGDIYGDRLEEDIVGGTVCWNQLVQNGNFADATIWSASRCTYTVANNTATIVKTNNPMQFYQMCPTVMGHKYAVLGRIKANGGYVVALRFGSVYDVKTLTANTWTDYGTIWQAGSVSSEVNVYSNDNNMPIDGEIQAQNIMLIDLTAHFGNATVADAIYNMEQAEAGSGIALLKASGFFNGYIPYDAGTLKSVNPTAHVTRGVNAWDEEWELGSYDSSGNPTSGSTTIRSKNYVPVIGGTAYNFPAMSMVTYWYDGDKNFVWSKGTSTSDHVITAPSNAMYMRFRVGSDYGTTYNNDICINISNSEVNGQYFPYEEHTYDLGNVPLYGLFQLVNNKLKAYGDVRHAVGGTDRKFALLDLGTLTWGTPNENGRVSATPQSVGKYYSSMPNVICTKYVAISASGWYNSDIGNGITICGGGYGGNGNIGIVDSSFIGKTSAEVKTALSGTMLVYEKATPTTETTDPFTQIQEVSKYGTLEYITTNDVPVGHNTTYMTRDVFGGYIDLVSGQLVVDWKAVFYDGSADETWGMETQIGDKSFYIARQSDAKALTDINLSNMLYSTFPFRIDGWSVGECRLTNGYYNFVVGSVVGATTVDQWRAWLKDNPISYTYELATPLTYQLTPQQIQTLVGVNNVWSEQGDIEVIFTRTIQSDTEEFNVGGIYDVTYVAEDQCGNKTQVTRQIQVGTLRTVLYADGTFIINEPSEKIEENTRIHGTASYIYDPFDADHDYVFEVYYDDVQGTMVDTRPWATETADVTRIEIGSTIKPTDMSYWFYEMQNAESADVSKIDTSQTEFMMSTFAYCGSLEELDLTTFDMSSVISDEGMLYQCLGLKSLDISGWVMRDGLQYAWTDDYQGASSYIQNVEQFLLNDVDTSQMTSMRYMFNNLRKVEALDLSSFDTSNVLDMNGMFTSCYELQSLDLSNFDTSKVTDMTNMFGACNSLTYLDVSDFDTSNVTTMAYMFSGCLLMDYIEVSNFDTSNVTDMQGMFSYCESLRYLTLCFFNTANVENMRFMFAYCDSLTGISVTDRFVTTGITNPVYGEEMFNGDTSLVGGGGTTYDANHTGKEYAVIDRGDSVGYFTSCLS